MGSTRRSHRGARTAFALLVAVPFALVSCGGGSDGGASVDVPLTLTVPTTAAPPAPVDPAETWASYGLDADEVACILASPIEAERIVEPLEAEGDPIAVHFEGADAPVIVVPDEVGLDVIERQVLDLLASGCLSEDERASVASLRAAERRREFDTALADHLNARTSDGATPDEVGCLDSAFRTSPGRLVGLVASPRVIERRCVGDERLAEWREAALRRGFDAAGASESTIGCLVSSPGEQLLLADAVGELTAAVGSNGAEGGVGTPVSVPDGWTCSDPDEFAEIARNLASDVSAFGVETIGGG